MFSGLVAKIFNGSIVLNGSKNTVIAPTFDAELNEIEQLTEGKNAPVEGQILNFDQDSTKIWPRCPNANCFNKNVRIFKQFRSIADACT